MLDSGRHGSGRRQSCAQHTQHNDIKDTPFPPASGNQYGGARSAAPAATPALRHGVHHPCWAPRVWSRIEEKQSKVLAWLAAGVPVPVPVPIPIPACLPAKKQNETQRNATQRRYALPTSLAPIPQSSVLGPRLVLLLLACSSCTNPPHHHLFC